MSASAKLPRASTRRAPSGQPGAATERHPFGPFASLDDFTPHRMAVVANRMSQSIGRLFEARFNLQVPDWRILMVLYAYGRLAFNDVVERTSMDKARVSRAHRRLADLGLLSTESDPHDGRRRLLTLTDQGAKMCGDVLPEAARTEAWLLEALDADERRQLACILDKLMARTRLLTPAPNTAKPHGQPPAPADPPIALRAPRSD